MSPAPLGALNQRDETELTSHSTGSFNKRSTGIGFDEPAATGLIRLAAEWSHQDRFNSPQPERRMESHPESYLPAGGSALPVSRQRRVPVEPSWFDRTN